MFARSRELSPDQFWSMTMAELHLEHEIVASRSGSDGTYAGTLTRGDCDDLREWMDHG